MHTSTSYTSIDYGSVEFEMHTMVHKKTVKMFWECVPTYKHTFPVVSWRPKAPLSTLNSITQKAILH